MSNYQFGDLRVRVNGLGVYLGGKYLEASCDKLTPEQLRIANREAWAQKRLEGLDSISWVDSMVKLISSSGEVYFRWHDSGDLQSLQHLLDIVRIAEKLPSVSFWLPTKEKKLVYQYRETFGDFPSNLCVRLSAAMVNIQAPAYSGNTSTVHTTTAIGSECPAPKQGNKCLDCRACWSRDIKNVSYQLH